MIFFWLLWLVCALTLWNALLERLNDNAALDWGPVNNKNLEDFATDYIIFCSQFRL